MIYNKVIGPEYEQTVLGPDGWESGSNVKADNNFYAMRDPSGSTPSPKANPRFKCALRCYENHKFHKKLIT